KESLEELSDEEFDRTFKTNVYAYFRLVKAALPHLRPGASIIVTGSETGFEGPEMLPDYSATKGAIQTMTKALAKMLAERVARVGGDRDGRRFLHSRIGGSADLADKAITVVYRHADVRDDDIRADPGCGFPSVLRGHGRGDRRPPGVQGPPQELARILVVLH